MTKTIKVTKINYELLAANISWLKNDEIEKSLYLTIQNYKKLLKKNNKK